MDGASHRGLRRIEPLAAHDLVYEELQRAIETWVFRPGQFLPPERELAELLGVSRNTLRQASLQLERDGVVSVRRGREGGYLVLDPALVADRSEEVRRNPRLLTDVWDFMAPVNVAAARLAAVRRTGVDLRRLSEIEGELARVYDQFTADPTLEVARESHALDLDFHIAIGVAAKNDHLVEAIVDCRRKMWIAFSSYLTTLDPSNRARRAAILGAIEARDGDSTASLMEHHLLAGRALFDSWLEQGSDGEVVAVDNHSLTRSRSPRTEIRYPRR